ncbi:serine/arginine repetitive matrix protein 1 [Phlebotomus argentipes]|uniref:serine/arginine repetitive matrix protein 1 n=1 Tax=Phlebotomus argentipes TaxID=94469 RepID=UPI002892C193|nr:serine/arginine repetitive matrix protein 1 [Phlebotomus argentipes]
MPEKPVKCTCPSKRQSLVDAVSPSKISTEKRQSVPSPFHQSLVADASPKCTCSVGQKAPKPRPVPLKRDMATSPNLAPKSPTIKVSSEEDEKEVELQAPEICAVTLPSPRAERATRNAATSPRLEVKHKASPLRENPNRVLEKSNSLGEKKPSRVLRNTRSLSPRPPVKHQHAITVSDENDVVSVKLSPNDEFVEEEAKKLADPSPKKKTRSAHASPNLSDCGGLAYEDRFANNRSTGCLVYVPSDPWLRLSDEEEAMDTLRQGRKKKKDKKRVEKAHSRPNILEGDDPWVWKGPSDAQARKNAYRQSKSLQSTAGEYSSLKHLPGKKDASLRPKLQRSKSPVLMMNDLEETPVQKSANLSVANHLLPRHSFSTTPTQRDDELQLNIRRLSEQMRHSPAYNTAYDGREKILDRRRTASPLPPPPPPPADPLLETTC